MLHLNNFPELGGRSTSHIRSNFSSSISLTEATWDILPKYSPNSSWAEWRSSASTTRLKYHLRVLLQRLARPLRKLQTWLNRSKYVTVILNHFFFHCQDKSLSQVSDNRSGVFWSARCSAFKILCNNQVASEQRALEGARPLLWENKIFWQKVSELRPGHITSPCRLS